MPVCILQGVNGLRLFGNHCLSFYRRTQLGERRSFLLSFLAPAVTAFWALANGGLQPPRSERSGVRCKRVLGGIHKYRKILHRYSAIPLLWCKRYFVNANAASFSISIVAKPYYKRFQMLNVCLLELCQRNINQRPLCYRLCLKLAYVAFCIHK